MLKRARDCCRGAVRGDIGSADADVEVEEVVANADVASLCRHNRQTDLVPLIPSKKLDRV